MSVNQLIVLLCNEHFKKFKKYKDQLFPTVIGLWNTLCWNWQKFYSFLTLILIPYFSKLLLYRYLLNKLWCATYYILQGSFSININKMSIWKNIVKIQNNNFQCDCIAWILIRIRIPTTRMRIVLAPILIFYYFIVSYAEILRFLGKKFLDRANIGGSTIIPLSQRLSRIEFSLVLD